MNDLILLSEALLAEGIGVGSSMLVLRIKQERFPKELGYLHLAMVGSGLVLLLLSLLSGTPVYGPFVLFVLGAGEALPCLSASTPATVFCQFRSSLPMAAWSPLPGSGFCFATSSLSDPAPRRPAAIPAMPPTGWRRHGAWRRAG